MPTVSIIIPTYNSEETIVETVASVQQQTITDWELIIIDDGSQDNTVEVVQKIAEPRKKLFAFENGGVSVARNRGIAEATGQYLAFLDADDLWTSDKLSSQIEALKQNAQAKVAYSWTNYIDERGELLYHGSPFPYQGNVLAELLQTNFLLNASSVLVHRDVLNLVPGFNPKLAYAADWDFYWRLAKNFDFALVPKHQIFYRQSANSMSSKIEDLKKESLQALDLTFEDVPKQLTHIKNIGRSNCYLYCAELYLNKIAMTNNQQNLRNAWQDMSRAIILHPYSLFNINTQRSIAKLFRWKLYFVFFRPKQSA